MREAAHLRGARRHRPAADELLPLGQRDAPVGHHALPLGQGVADEPGDQGEPGVGLNPGPGRLAGLAHQAPRPAPRPDGQVASLTVDVGQVRHATPPPGCRPDR